MRYQSFSLRTQRLTDAANHGGWNMVNSAPYADLPIWTLTHPGAKGSVPRVAWAMMHGNEPTGFEALLQFIHQGKPSSDWTLIPMVNPSGVDRFTRRTKDGVDLNRCARQNGPLEADTLKAILQSRPYALALNLHDQRSIFHPEGAAIPSSFSVLAPRSQQHGIETQPKAALDWAGSLSKWMRESQPHWGFSKFDDQYYPTAFGEWVQELGIPTVTVETGVALGDASRSKVAHALAGIMSRIDATAVPDVDGGEVYASLPHNANTGCDLMMQSGTEASYWKHWEVVQEGVYESGLERVESPQSWAYQKLDVPFEVFQRLNQDPILTTLALYATGIDSLRTLAEGLPR